jgi:5'-deoxynucleotidase YfbR-like HD superfamily hydrolase
MSFQLVEKMRFLRQAAYVKRFHTLPMGQQTIAHHSYGVAMIIQNFWPDCRKELLLAALYHDVPELVTGDTPAPFKWSKPELAATLHDFEERFLHEYEWHHELTESEKRMLGIADTFDMILYCQEQIEMGNSTFMMVYQRGMAHLIHTYQGTEEIKPLIDLIEGLAELFRTVPKKEQH